MQKNDPSVSGAAQALIGHLHTTFPSVPLDTILAITTQHALDPKKCFDLVRLEASLPSSTNDDGAASFTNGGLSNSSEMVNERYCPSPLRPQGSYIIRRPAGSPVPHLTGVVRDSRSCTPPRGPPGSPGANLSPLVRPHSLGVRSVLHPNMTSPMTQRRSLPTHVDDVAHSCPGTPTGGQRLSRGYVGNIPSLKINYQTGGSQITLTQSSLSSSPTLVVSQQGGGRPVFYQLPRSTSHGPSSAVNDATGAPAWQYDRRPSFADVEIAHNSSGQLSGGTSTNSLGQNREPLRVSVENLNDGVIMSSGPGAPVAVITSDSLASTANAPSSPNIRIQLDGGGAVISSEVGSSGARLRPRVTFSPLVAIQQGSSRPTAALTVSLKQQTSPVYDPTVLAKTAASTHAQAQECLKSVLSHQRARSTDLKKAMVTAKARLQELQTDVESMEQDLTKRRKNSVRSETISDEAITALHRETRELQAEIQAMLRELDLHRQNAEETSTPNSSTIQGALHQGAFPGLSGRTTLAPNDLLRTEKKRINSDDSGHDDQWSCSLCTFRNHIDLPICECCEMPRVTDVDGWQFVYDISPSAFE